MKWNFLLVFSSLCVGLFVSMLLHAAEAPQIFVKGLFSGRAILMINGQQVMLKEGQSSPEGVRLVSASSKVAIVEFEGKTQQLELSRGIGTTYKAAERSEVRLNSQHNGHYFGTARINGRAVQFLVDTGASSVAMSSAVANRIGLRYKDGRRIMVSTAQGTTQGFMVTARSVEVGGIRIENVAVTVLEGEYPLDVLLGNSFLGQVDMRIENDVLVLRTKY